MAVTKKQRAILIAGGSGLIGRALWPLLQQNGLHPRLLSRQPQNTDEERYYWDPERGFLNPDALNQVDAIVNLAGAGIADRKWSPRRKQEILESRVQSHELILQKLEESRDLPRTLVAASAIGYYGNGGETLLTEESPAGKGFVAEVCQRWEKAALRFEQLGIRTVILRIGVVLDAGGGALKKMMQPIRYFVGAPLGSGSQQISWVHSADVAAMILRALQDESWRGVYNCTAPMSCSNRELTSALAARLGRPLLLPSIPEGALRLALGEMSSLLLDSARVSPQRALDAGFNFRYPELDGALQSILGGRQ